MGWEKELEELRLKRELASHMGGAEGIARQKSQGKLTVRERLDLLLDADSFQEIKTSLGQAEYDDEGELRSFRPGNVVAGYGTVNGRPVCVRADDFTIRGGSSDAAGAAKRPIEQMAVDRRVPLIRLLDGAGGSVREVAGAHDVTSGAETAPAKHGVETAAERPVALRQTGVPGAVNVPEHAELRHLTPMVQSDLALRAQGNLLAQIPVVSAVLGSCAGWIAIAAAESHWSVMTRDTSELFVGGPPLVKQALGIDISKQELGNYKVHVEHTGVVHNLAEDEADACEQIGTFLGYLPESVWQLPPRAEPTDDPNRREEALLSFIPRERRKAYDIRKLIALVVDRGSTFEISRLFGRSLVTMLARIDGFPLALIANDCHRDGGAQTAAACQKFERFVDFADTFHLPVVYLCDVPGFMIGPDSEHEGTLRWAARANAAVREANVPYASILIRRFYGVAMGGSKHGPGLNPRYAWPSAESGSLPASGGVMAAYRRVIEAAPDPEAKRIELEDRLNALASVLRRPQLVDEIIDPRDTRPLLCDFVRRAQEINATQLGPKLRVGMRP